jgi:hypothetical protein
MIQNPDIKESYFVDDIDNTTRDQRVKIATDCMREIENQGCGKNHAQKIGERYAKIGQTWFDGLGEAPSSEDKSIDDAVSEWADGDSIAAHIAYENDHFCTLDFAKKSGPSSILSPQNRAWLTSRYGVSFKTHKELAESLSD